MTQDCGWGSMRGHARRRPNLVNRFTVYLWLLENVIGECIENISFAGGGSIRKFSVRPRWSSQNSLLLTDTEVGL